MRALAGAAIGLLLLCGAARAAPPDPVAAQLYFEEAEAACAADRGWLWNGTLCGPMLFVDPETRQVIANEAGPQGGLVRTGRVHAGALPAAIDATAPTAEWLGQRWAVVAWPAPPAADARLRLMMARHWRRAMEARGLTMRAPGAEHLAETEARIAARLEWRALAAALMAPSRNGQRRAIADALSFRAWRRTMDANAASVENAMELTDGLAAYTGLKLSGATAPEARVAALLREAEEADTLGAVYASVAGPAYGLLLDRFDGAAWRRRLTPGADLGALLADAGDVSPPGAGAAEQLASGYGGVTLTALEGARALARESVYAIARRRFVTGPVLTLPLADPEVDADASTALTLPEAGVAHESARIIDAWGVLEARAGVLIETNGEGARLVAPLGLDAFEGPGWRLEAAPGWVIERAEKPGDYVLKFRGAPVEEETPDAEGAAAAEGSEQPE